MTAARIRNAPLRWSMRASALAPRCGPRHVIEGAGGRGGHRVEAAGLPVAAVTIRSADAG